MLFYFGITKGNFLLEVTLEQELKGREEGPGRQRRGQCVLEGGHHQGKSTEAASLSNRE